MSVCPDTVVRVEDPPSHHRLHRMDSARLRRIRIVFHVVWAVFFLIAVAMIAALAHLVVLNSCRPQSPRILVESVLVSPVNASNSHIIADWTMRIGVRNPNRFTDMDYKHFEVSTYYSNNSEYWLAMDTVAPFKQKSRNETTLAANLRARSEEGVEGLIVIGGDMHGSVVSFDIKMQIRAKYACKANLLSQEKASYEVLCKDVKVGFSPNATQGTMIEGEPKKCYVHPVS